MATKLYPETKFIHYYDTEALSKEEQKNSDQFCIAYRIYQDKIELGVAFCSDNYEKSIGRRIATVRLTSIPIILERDFIIETIFNENSEELCSILSDEEEVSYYDYSLFKFPMRKKLIDSIRVDDIRIKIIKSFLIMYVLFELSDHKHSYIEDCSKVPAEIQVKQAILNEKEQELNELRKKKQERANQFKQQYANKV